jgi:phage terminase small subunit
MKQRGRKSAAKLASITDDLVQTTSDPPRPPADLSRETRAWWTDIVCNHELAPHQYRTLQAAAESWDRYQQARRLLAKQGLTYVDAKDMIRARPECAIERDSRVAFIRAMRELGLEKSEPPDHNKNCTIGFSWRDLPSKGRQ